MMMTMMITAARREGAEAWAGELAVWGGEVMFKRISTLPCTKFNLIYQWEKQPPKLKQRKPAGERPQGERMVMWRMCPLPTPRPTGEGNKRCFYLIFYFSAYPKCCFLSEQLIKLLSTYPFLSLSLSICIYLSLGFHFNESFCWILLLFCFPISLTVPF